MGSVKKKTKMYNAYFCKKTKAEKRRKIPNNMSDKYIGRVWVQNFYIKGPLTGAPRKVRYLGTIVRRPDGLFDLWLVTDSYTQKIKCSSAKSGYRYRLHNVYTKYEEFPHPSSWFLARLYVMQNFTYLMKNIIDKKALASIGIEL